MTETVIITGGPMQLVSWDPGSSGGTYSIEGINMILGGPSWALELDPSNNTCISVMTPGPVPSGAGPPTVCHVGAIDSMRSGYQFQSCPGCYKFTLMEGGQYLRDGGGWSGGKAIFARSVNYSDLPTFHWTSHSVPEPSVWGLIAVAALAAFLWHRPILGERISKSPLTL